MAAPIVTNQAMALTADDIAAFKLADSVTFHHYEGRSFIRAHLDNTSGERIFTAREQRLFQSERDSNDRHREITCDVTMYGYSQNGFESWNLESAPGASAFHYGFAAKYDKPWQTIAGLLRAGDRLRLEWVADNNNDNVRGVGFHCDELRLIVVRTNKRTDASHDTMTFRIVTQVGPDNSARLIRRYGR